MHLKKMNYSYKGTLNQCTIIGELKEVPEVQHEGTHLVARATLLTHYPVIDQETGKVEDRYESHHIVLYDELAQKISKDGKRGIKVLIQGPKHTKKLNAKENDELEEIIAITCELFY